MIKHITKRWLALTLVLVMMIGFMPTLAFAASVNTGVTGLTADSSGSATWTGSNGTITGSVAANKSSGCTGDSFTEQNGTLTFTNNSGAVGQLSFDYTIELNDGSATVDGASVTANSSFSKTLPANGTVEVAITSNAANETATKITISNLKLTPEKNVDVTFKAPSHGSYTVDGTAVTAQTVKTVKTTDSVALAATAASGYKFFGWKNETTGSYLSTSAAFTTSFTENVTVFPEFVPNSVPVFQVGSKLYTDLNEAISYAQTSGTAKITLVSNGTLPAGNYTIPSGKTLLIPYDEANTVCTTTTQITENLYPKPSVYRKLTMASGANIIIGSGASLSVASKVSSQGTGANSHNGTPTGPHGLIEMQEGSSITAKANSGLYVYGFITGNGNVYAEGQSTVYECFQIRDWRGGSASSGIADEVFPFNQYYVQNIEAPLTIYPGATEMAFSSANMPKVSMYPALAVEFIGSNGMFKVDSGTITKRYDRAADRLVIDVNDANASISSITLSGLPLVGEINTANYTLPISNKISINVNGSSTVTVDQDISMQPGTRLTIAEGSNVIIDQGHALYVYDAEDWNGKGYAAGGNPLVVNCYVGSTGAAGSIKEDDKLDAKVEVNGTLTVNGKLCTSEGGANITSSAAGSVVLNAAPSGGTVNESVGTTGEVTPVTFYAAKLKNADRYDPAYTESAGKPTGATATYVTNHWSWGAKTITYKANVPSQMIADVTQSTEDNQVSLKSFEDEAFAAFVYEGHTFKGWNTEADGTGTSYEDAQADVEITEDLTLYAQWEEAAPSTFTVTLVCEEEHTFIEGKTEEDLSYPVERTETFTMPQNIFVREGFQFAGWTFTAPGEEGDNTVYTAGQEVPFATVFPEGVTETRLYAVWKQIFTVTFIDQEGQQVGEVQQVASGEKPVIPEGPTAEPTQMYTYEFIGWFDTDTEEELTADTVIIADTVFEAKYREQLRSYTVTFQDEEGNKIGNDQTVAYGSQPGFPENPGKDGDAQYSYSFEGWYVNNTKIDPETFTVEGDVTIVAKFTQSVNSYEIKFVDYDNTLIETQTVKYGQTPVAPAAPSRASTAQYDYTFAGWDPEIHAVTGAQTYKATYTESPRSYTVKFLDYDGTELKSEKLAYGAVPTAPAAPSRASTDQYDYNFSGWDKEITEVTGDVTYTATYEATLRSYTVTFVDEDGTTELKKETVTYDSQIPAYVPEKEGYDFIAWLQLDGSAAPETVTGDLTLKASWQIKTFTVTWYDEDGTTVLATNTAEYNQKPTVPDIVPAKASDETWDYTFARWDDLSDTTVITEDTSFKAVYTATLHDYTITWILGNGEENIVKTYHYGDILIVPENPVKASTEKYDYSFTVWNPVLPDPLEVTGDATFTAQYDETLRSYEIKFVDYDNTLIETQTVKYGQTPVAPADPTRDADEQYTYTFAGWDPAVAAVTGEQTYTATYTQTTRQYTVTFLDEKGATLDTQTVEYGNAPLFPAVPEQYYDESGEHVYSFDGWYVDSEKIDPDTFVVTGAVTIKAQYNEGIAEYTIKFVNEDGTVLDEQTLAYGATPVYGGQKPTKAPTAEFEYSFKAWSPAITSVTCDATYTATFEAATRSYLITFYDEDGETVLDQQNVKYGVLPVYAGPGPVKAPDETYVYVFAGWDPEIHAVTGEQTYTATYTPEQPSYTVTWKFNNGKEDLVEELQRGETIDKPADPVKDADAQYFYSFTGWSPEVPEKIDRDMVFNAVYGTTLRSYEIRFVDYDNTLIETQTVEYGQTPDAPADPTREADEQYTYTFAGWNPAVAAVNGEQTYTATYTPTTRQYTVTFLNEDGTRIANKLTDYNTTPEYPEVPEKIDETGEFLYAFDAWYVRTEVEGEIVDTKIEDPESFKILGDVTIVLKYSKTTAAYAVIFQDDAGQQIGETQMVAFGSKPVYPDDPTKVDPNGQFVYSFDGWYVNGEKIDKDSFVVNGAVTIAARFTSETAKYEIRFLDAQGEQIGETQTVEYGSAPTVPVGPAKEQDDTYTYAFIGWFVQGDAEETIVTDFTVRGDAVYAPKYESAFRTYTILFVDDEGKVLDTQSLHYGDMPTAPTNPEKAPTELGSFTFVKWDKEITSVTGDATYTAIFSYTGWKIAENGERTYFVEDELQKTGLTTIDGKLYYLDPETGVAAAGWQNFNDKALYDWYYFDPVTGAAASGVVTMQETFYFKGDPEKTFDITYTFDPETHKLIDGTWISYGDSQENPLPTDNQRLRWAGYFPTKTWIKAGEETYYLNASGFRVKGTVPAPVDGETDKYGLYIFNEANGALVSRVEAEGFYSVGDETYYLIDNYVGYWGLIKVDGNYYYVKSNTFTLVKNQEYTITKINGLDKQKGSYLFDEEGRMLDGIVTIDGKMYFYKEGKKFYEGLYVEYYDANDNKLPDDQGAVKAVYYYFTSRTFEAVCNQRYYITKTNDLLPRGYYTFDENCQYIVFLQREGIVEEGGKLYFYENGKKVYKGLYVEYYDADGNKLQSESGAAKAVYYYFTSRTFEAVTNANYYVTRNNDLLPKGYYYFDENGQYIVVLAKNGIVEEDGNLYFYQDGKKIYAGLVQDENGDFYYFTSRNFSAVKGKSYYITKTNDLLPRGTYTFDADGKLVR